MITYVLGVMDRHCIQRFSSGVLPAASERASHAMKAYPVGEEDVYNHEQDIVLERVVLKQCSQSEKALWHTIRAVMRLT